MVRPTSVREHYVSSMHLNRCTPEMTHLHFGLAFLGKNLTKLYWLHQTYISHTCYKNTNHSEIV